MSSLPRFDNPPVAETAIGVEFAPIEGWEIPHFGVYWQRIRDRFPSCATQPPIPSIIENFDKSSARPAAEIRVVQGMPYPRCWFISDSGNTLIQVQNNRFHYNWRRLQSEHRYPRYDETIRPAFVNEWNVFNAFVQQEIKTIPIDVIQCEVTYVNHFELGREWNGPEDICEVLPVWAGRTSGRFLPPPEDLTFQIHYRMPNEAGRLTVKMLPVLQIPDNREMLQLSIVARGKPASGSFEDAMRWIDIGREWVVRGFCDITSDKMHKIWKRRQ